MEIKRHILSWVDQSKKIDPNGIVLHYWAEPIERGGISLLEKLWKPLGLSCQFAVLADGTVYQLVESPDVRCAHAKAANNSTIGIEIQGQGPADLDANEIQFQAVVELVDYLMKAFKIGKNFQVERVGTPDVRFSGIATHQMVDVCCPGANGKVDVHLDYLVRVIAHLSQL